MTRATPDPRLAELTRQLGGLVSQVRLNRNDKTLISLRGSRWEGIRLSLHHRLLDHPQALAELPGWIRGRGRQPGPALREAIDAVFNGLARERRSEPLAVPDFPPLGGPLLLTLLYDAVHRAWFPHLSKPLIAWGPRPRAMGRRRRIRFAAYYRRPTPRIVVNRLLDQPWVAREFVAYVLYHELCHHAQAMDPVRGETPHSTRFKAWEARYPRFHELLVWEKAHLDRFLAAPEDGTAAQQASTG